MYSSEKKRSEQKCAPKSKNSLPKSAEISRNIRRYDGTEPHGPVDHGSLGTL